MCTLLALGEVTWFHAPASPALTGTTHQVRAAVEHHLCIRSALPFVQSRLIADVAILSQGKLEAPCRNPHMSGCHPLVSDDCINFRRHPTEPFPQLYRSGATRLQFGLDRRERALSVILWSHGPVRSRSSWLVYFSLLVFWSWSLGGPRYGHQTDLFLRPVMSLEAFLLPVSKPAMISVSLQHSLVESDRASACTRAWSDLGHMQHRVPHG